MNLELKHLSPYLPYGLKFGLTRVNDQFRCTGLTIHEDGIMAHHKKGSSNVSLDRYYKPILRPMADLSTRYGEGVINEHSINTLLGKDGNYGEVTVSQWKDYFDIEIELGYDAPLTKSIDFKIMMIIIDELYRGHFDVFGLIPAGLAIDINTL